MVSRALLWLSAGLLINVNFVTIMTIIIKIIIIIIICQLTHNAFINDKQFIQFKCSNSVKHTYTVDGGWVLATDLFLSISFSMRCSVWNELSTFMNSATSRSLWIFWYFYTHTSTHTYMLSGSMDRLMMFSYDESLWKCPDLSYTRNSSSSSSSSNKW